MPGRWPKPDFILPVRSARGQLRGKTENTLAILIPPQNQLTVPEEGIAACPLPVTSLPDILPLSREQRKHIFQFLLTLPEQLLVIFSVKLRSCLWIPQRQGDGYQGNWKELARRRSDFSGYFFVLYLGWMLCQTNQMGVFLFWRNKAIIYLKKDW